MKTQEIFEGFSPFNFSFSKCREATERLLDQEMKMAERRADQEHEHQDFEVCQDCARARRRQFQPFAQHFALVRARVALQKEGWLANPVLAMADDPRIINEVTRQRNR
jgi:hypothetical protein